MAHQPSCGAFALPAQCSSPSAPGTSPVRPPARAMRQPIRAQHVAGALPTRTMRQPIHARHVAGASALPAQCSSPYAHGTSPVRCLPAQCASTSVPGTSPVRPPARTMHQPAAWSSFHRKTVIPPRRHNITQSHHDSALSQTYNTANSQYQCRTYAGSHRRRGASQLPPYPRNPISLKPGSMQLLRAFHLCPAGWTRCARPAHGMACPNNLLHWDTFGVKIK